MSPRERGRGLPYAVVGNGAITALVHPDTGIDWLCLPRIDGPSVFGRLLDDARGGAWAFEAADPVRSSHAAYVPNTNVLRTEVRTATGRYEVIDAAPWRPHGWTSESPLALIRLVRPLEGRPRLRMRFEPRPDYGREEPQFVHHDDGLCFYAAGSMVQVQGSLDGPAMLAGEVLELTAPLWFRLGVGGSRQHDLDLAAVEREVDVTTTGWRHWTARCTTNGFADAHVLRSALCLKLLASPMTGATVAAATTSIPEALGEPRTWDYRFCWLRDSVFTVEAFRRVGHVQEGHAFLNFVLEIAGSGPLQPLYGIGGERHLPEVELPHLRGFQGTGPVRVGNAAALQTQHDLMGEVVLSMRTLFGDPRFHRGEVERWFPLLERMVAESIAAFPEPDLGIWEYREGPRLHTFSRAMCWAAVHHGADLAAMCGRGDEAATWRRRADAMRAEVLERGYDAEHGMFVQSFGDRHPDAANLLLPSIGLIDARDPRFRSTLERYRELLVNEHGVMRYLHEDDFGSPSSTFTICSFWWCEALALAGELDEAKERFASLLDHANPVGLFSEDVSVSTGELLGNFPQAYTHVGLINAALTIGSLDRAAAGRFHAWT